MNNIFIQLAIILGLSSALGFITYKLKLPLLIAYLMGGLLIALWGIFDVRSSQALSFLPEIGLAFLLFLVGMELDFREIKSFGKPIIISAILQTFITGVFGSFIAQSFGFNLVESIYLGVGLAFSSTIVVLKLLLEKKDLSSLYGKLSLGILLLEDLLAVVILLGLTSTVNGSEQGLSIFLLVIFMVKALMLLSFALFLNHYILGTIFKAVSESQELLFLTALAWCFIYVTFATLLGFSVVIGAFLAGIALANSPYHFQIGGKVKPMRDFFVALFFVYLGTKVNFIHINQTLPVILTFSLYALFIKPVIFLLLLGSFGFRKHTLFQTSITLSQISEFSLIIILVGFEQGLIGSEALSVIATSALISIIISSVMIENSKRIYKMIAPFITFFERGKKYQIAQEKITSEISKHVVLIGSHQVGEHIVKFLEKESLPFVVLDFNPFQVEKLLAAKIPVIFGDMGDPEVLQVLALEKAKLIISTVPDLEDNKLLIEDIRTRNKSIPIIVRSDSVKDAKKLYLEGASFVYIPDIVSGNYLVEILENHLDDWEYFKNRSKKELEKLSRETLSWQG